MQSLLFPMTATFVPDFQSSRSVSQRLQTFMFLALLYFCQNLAPFNTLCFSWHLSHIAVDFVTLSCTEMTIFPTL